jgi:thiamine biosynthesis lipoprotein
VFGLGFKLIRKSLIILVVIGVAFFFWQTGQKHFEYEKEVLGTLCRLQIKANPAQAKKISDEVFALWQDIQDKTNILDSKSEISVLNSKKQLQVSERLYEMIAEGYVLSQKTSGYFDITIGALTCDLFAGKKLSEIEIKKRLSKVNYQKINMDNKTKTVWIKQSVLRLDVWGMSKGYAADKTMEILKKQGVKEALIDLGGQITILGADKKISLEDPQNPGHIWQEVLLKNGQTLSTSNQVWQGKHIFVPGNKVRKENFQSVSVITNQGAVADALSTAIFVAGDQNFVKQFNDVQVFVKK